MAVTRHMSLALLALAASCGGGGEQAQSLPLDRADCTEMTVSLPRFPDASSDFEGSPALRAEAAAGEFTSDRGGLTVRIDGNVRHVRREGGSGGDDQGPCPDHMLAAATVRFSSEAGALASEDLPVQLTFSKTGQVTFEQLVEVDALRGTPVQALGHVEQVLVFGRMEEDAWDVTVRPAPPATLPPRPADRAPEPGRADDDVSTEQHGDSPWIRYDS